MNKYLLDYIIVDGKNAVTGKCTRDCHNYIFKYSGQFSSVIDHEYKILKRLEQLNLPYFPKLIDFFHFDRSCSDLLIMEFIEGQLLKFFSFEEKKKICALLLLIIEYVHVLTGFTHYDSHSSNVLVKKVKRRNCSFNIKGKTYTIDNYGYLPSNHRLWMLIY